MCILESLHELLSKNASATNLRSFSTTWSSKWYLRENTGKALPFSNVSTSIVLNFLPFHRPFPARYRQLRAGQHHPSHQKGSHGNESAPLSWVITTCIRFLDHKAPLDIKKSLYNTR